MTTWTEEKKATMIKALRSGEYGQARNYLRGMFDYNGKHLNLCCIGVGDHANGNKKIEAADFPCATHMSAERLGLLDLEVPKDAPHLDMMQVAGYTFPIMADTWLIYQNDKACLSFEQIADNIEKYL